ncbi:MAG: pyridoxal-phosphate dependent enzyme [Chitinophagales bacterium]
MFEAASELIRVPTPLQRLPERWILDRGVELWLKRDDLTHPLIQGNKWRKLKYNLLEAKRLGYQQLLTFGGAYSNHIAAVAAAGKFFGFKTIGIIRGEPTPQPSHTLLQAAQNGMAIHFMSRDHYRLKDEPGMVEDLAYQFGEFYALPEGGTNELALEGCREMIDEIDVEFDVVACAVGTGGTSAGIWSELNEGQHLHGFSALKGTDTLSAHIGQLAQSRGVLKGSFQLHTDYHFGGYAKVTDELLQFMRYIHVHHRVMLDQVYTAKMLYGLYDLIRMECFPKGTRIVAIHTGGLQGNSHVIN